MTRPAKALEPTPVGDFGAAFAVDIIRPAWLSLCRQLLMKSHTIGRIISAVIFGVLLASAVHLDHLKRGKLGREEFIAKQAARYDRHFAKSDPIGVEVFVSVFMAGSLFGAYELVAFVISKTLKSVGYDESSG